ncbi:MAG: hypothetical protein B6U94_04210 [Thermofilum sp. ex4484_79]|nr:MAG: hypothetical protein B6U94_04210 [Thermofilum sp. ex4484_79]
MKRTGITDLPLHGGRAPRWLFNRMVKLAGPIVRLIIDEYGVKELLTRLSDPFWFQAFGNVLGYDWHSSGLTTVLTAVLKEAINPEKFNIAVCGGKGKIALKTPVEILEISEKLGLSDAKAEKLKHISFITAKVDNAAIQDGYKIYHHSIIFTREGEWAVIQQGMNDTTGYARRYHWLSYNISSLVDSPHSAIVGDKRHSNVLNMVASESREARKVSVDLVKEDPKKIYSMLKQLSLSTYSLDRWIKGADTLVKVKGIKYLLMPRKMNWDTLRKAYEFQPKNYEELLSIKGVGPAVIRGLALVSELIYGTEVSWKDPVKYSFAYGGKDGVPYPVNRRAMDRSIQLLEESIRMAEIGERERLNALKRLHLIVPKTLSRT